MSHVLLLRAPSDGKAEASTGGGADPYESKLAPATSVAVYETVHTLDELQWILETGPAFHGYKGVIVTSKRAVDAWAAAAQKVPPPVDERAHWTDVPFYTVGPATASTVQELSRTLNCASCLAPRQVLGGEETGTGEQLAHFILARLARQREAGSTRSTATASIPGSHSSTSLPLTGSVSTDNLSIFTRPDGQGHAFSQAPEDKDNTGTEGDGEGRPTSTKAKRSRILRRPTKLLFLVGDKTRDVLPTILSADENVELDSVQVYATKPSPNFANALRIAVQAQPKAKDWWIAIFAPSGADYAIPFLREHFTLPSTFSSASPTSPSSSMTPSPSSSSNLTPNAAAPTKSKKFFSRSKDKQKVNGGGGAGAGGGEGGPLPVAKIAAIGPTTAAHLRETCKLEVAAVATKPNAESLYAAINAAK